MKFSNEPNLKREPRLSEQVANFLTSEIEKGAVRSGDSLPSEAELSYRFNVSRTVIREALARLKHDGILESKQGCRTIVTKSKYKRNFSLTGLGGKKSIQLTTIYELRALLEGDAAALAANRHSNKDLKSLKSCLDSLNQSVQNGFDGTNANVNFHEVIIEACGNLYLIEFMRFINEKFWDLIHGDKSQPSNLVLTSQSQNEHIAIYEAIVGRDPNLARKVVLKHLKNAAHRRGITILD